MKKDIHPDYHEITVVMTDGTEFKTRSTYGKAGEKMELQVDPLTHPAWTGGGQRFTEGGRLAQFNKRFGVKKAAAAKPASDEKKADETPAQ